MSCINRRVMDNQGRLSPLAGVWSGVGALRSAAPTGSALHAPVRYRSSWRTWRMHAGGGLRLAHEAGCIRDGAGRVSAMGTVNGSRSGFPGRLER